MKANNMITGHHYTIIRNVMGKIKKTCIIFCEIENDILWYKTPTGTSTMGVPVNGTTIAKGWFK